MTLLTPAVERQGRRKTLGQTFPFRILRLLGQSPVKSDYFAAISKEIPAEKVKLVERQIGCIERCQCPCHTARKVLNKQRSCANWEWHVTHSDPVVTCYVIIMPLKNRYPCCLGVVDPNMLHNPRSALHFYPFIISPSLYLNLACSLQCLLKLFLTPQHVTTMKLKCSAPTMGSKMNVTGFICSILHFIVQYI